MTNTTTATTATTPATWLASHTDYSTFGCDVLASDPNRGGGCTFIAFTGENNGRNIDHASLNVHNVANVKAVLVDVSANGNGHQSLTLRIDNGGIATEVSLFGRDLLATLQAALDNVEVL